MTDNTSGSDNTLAKPLILWASLEYQKRGLPQLLQTHQARLKRAFLYPLYNRAKPDAQAPGELGVSHRQGRATEKVPLNLSALRLEPKISLLKSLAWGKPQAKDLSKLPPW